MPFHLLLLTTTIAITVAGEPRDGYPNWHERAVYVLTNACRMDPTGYRDRYVGSAGILTPSAYPAVNPLGWNYALNQAARAHATDMSQTCGLQHASCNGIAWSTRIQSYYQNKNSRIGENIACGNESPFVTMNQWINDGNPPAPDASGSDGHRANIMKSTFREFGVGYAYGPQRYRHFWVQDFGGGTPENSSVVFGGCHFLVHDDSLLFLLNYYSNESVPPSGIVLILEGEEVPMQRILGTHTRGTYAVADAQWHACRQYFFRVELSGAVFERYPGHGSFLTWGDGACSRDYTPVVDRTHGHTPIDLRTGQIRPRRHVVVDLRHHGMPSGHLFTVRGRRLHHLSPAAATLIRMPEAHCLE